MKEKPNSNAVKALKAGKKLTYPTLADHEYIYLKDGNVLDENEIVLGTLEQFQESEADYNWTVKEEGNGKVKS